MLADNVLSPASVWLTNAGSAVRGLRGLCLNYNFDRFWQSPKWCVISPGLAPAARFVCNNFTKLLPLLKLFVIPNPILVIHEQPNLFPQDGRRQSIAAFKNWSRAPSFSGLLELDIFTFRIPHSQKGREKPALVK